MVCPYKKRLTIKPADGSPAYFSLVDCGKCRVCKKNHALEWARRCLDEAEYWQTGSFLTLTYAPDYLPHSPSGKPTVDKRDLQLFFKRLRKEVKSIAYFAVGEYGSQRGRPHYHILLYGWEPVDCVFWKTSRKGFPLYRSKFLEDVWKCGLVAVGLNFHHDCAAYCAKYADKKLFRPDEFFEGRAQEFQLSSRNILGQGAIGARWCRDNWRTVERGYLNARFNPKVIQRLPKYYWDLFEKEFHPFEFESPDDPIFRHNYTSYEVSQLQHADEQYYLQNERDYEDESCTLTEQTHRETLTR